MIEVLLLKSVKFFVHWMIEVRRSKPMPVSTCCEGRVEKVPSGFALYWMNTLFQISMHCAEVPLTSLPPVSPAGVRSTCSSVQGPQGPVSPIIQKLSFLLPFTMCTAGSSPTERNFSAQMSHASWSNSEGSPFDLSGL